MRDKIFGISAMSVEKATGALTRIKLELIAAPQYNPYHLEHEKWDELFPGKVVVKCAHCGQWAARKTKCVSCGAPVD